MVEAGAPAVGAPRRLVTRCPAVCLGRGSLCSGRGIESRTKGKAEAEGAVGVGVAGGIDRQILQLQIVTVVRARRPPLHFPSTVDGASAVVVVRRSAVFRALSWAREGEGRWVRAGEVGRGGRDAGRKERQREVSHASSRTENLNSESDGPPGSQWAGGLWGGWLTETGLGGSTNGAWTCRPWLPVRPERSGVGGLSRGSERRVLTDETGPGAFGRLGDSWIPL